MSLSTILLFFHLTNTLLVSLKSICCIGYNKYDSVLCLVAQSCLTLCDLMGCSPPGSSVHWYSPGKNTGVGCHALLQWNRPNPGIKPRSPTLQVDSLPSRHQGSPRILEWVSYPFSRGSSQPRNQTGISCIAGRFFTN